MTGHCILSHGFESGPDATKVTALADVAQRQGWTHERPDYTDLDRKREVTPLGDVAARIARLHALTAAAAARGPVVPVSYTHLDVYKRQPQCSAVP